MPKNKKQAKETAPEVAERPSNRFTDLLALSWNCGRDTSEVGTILGFDKYKISRLRNNKQTLNDSEFKNAASLLGFNSDRIIKDPSGVLHDGEAVLKGYEASLVFAGEGFAPASARAWSELSCDICELIHAKASGSIIVDVSPKNLMLFIGLLHKLKVSAGAQFYTFIYNRSYHDYGYYTIISKVSSLKIVLHYSIPGRPDEGTQDLYTCSARLDLYDETYDNALLQKHFENARRFMNSNSFNSVVTQGQCKRGSSIGSIEVSFRLKKEKADGKPSFKLFGTDPYSDPNLVFNNKMDSAFADMFSIFNASIAESSAPSQGSTPSPSQAVCSVSEAVSEAVSDASPAPVPSDTQRISFCCYCRASLDRFPDDIIYCPFCGKTLFRK